jgi:hypothetical protein
MSLNQNQFAQIPVQGQLDLSYNTTTIACQVDSTQVGSLVPGQSVKLIDSLGGVPKVVAVTSDSDTVFGFVNYNVKDRLYAAGDALEISSLYGNVMFLQATAAIARGALLKGVVATVGGVATVTAGAKIVGWALDKAANSGDLIRVAVNCPSFFVQG